MESSNMSKSTTLEPFVLDSYVRLFRDENAFHEFVGKMEAACQSGATPFFSGGKIIGVTVSNEVGKGLLYDHIIKQWIKDPAHLSRIAESMAEEPVPLKRK